MDEKIQDTGILQPFPTNVRTKTIAIGALLSAVYAVTVILPVSAFIGAGSILSFAIFIAPLFGIILGPRYGFVFGAIGGLLATIVSSQFGGLYLAIPTIIMGPALAGFFTGIAMKRTTKIGGFSVPGPLLTCMYLLIVIFLYLIPNFSAWWFIGPYALASIVALILQFIEIDLESLSPTKIGAYLVPITFIGTMTDFSMMTLGSVYILNLPADLFGYVIFPIMLLERFAATIISTILASVIISGFKSDLEFGR